MSIIPHFFILKSEFWLPADGSLEYRTMLSVETLLLEVQLISLSICVKLHLNQLNLNSKSKCPDSVVI